MKFVGVLFLIIISTSALSAQNLAIAETDREVYKDIKVSTFVFDMHWLRVDDVESIKAEDAGTHCMGEDVARKKCLLTNTYTYQVAISPGNPAKKTVYRKPTIYNAVCSIEKYLRKSAKKGMMSEEVAKIYFLRVIDAAINIYSQDTDKLEEVLKNLKQPEEQLDFFLYSIKINKLS